MWKKAYFILFTGMVAMLQFLSIPLDAAAQTRTDTCPPNINFEAGNLTFWESNKGSVQVGPGPSNLITWDQPGWSLNTAFPLRQALIDRNNANPLLDPWGNFPVNPPFGGGRYALMLGTDQNDPASVQPLPNRQADGIRYQISVPANAANFGVIFSYAVVFENPNHPQNIHTYEQQPRFIARVYEPGGDTLSCANFTFVASDPLPGFDTSAKFKIDSASGRFPGGINFALVKYKPWSTVFLNMSKYPGKTLYLEFITTDCTLRGHFGYAYVDVLECVAPVTAEINCVGNDTVQLAAPPGFKQYEWWNANYSTRIAVGDTVRVTGLKENDRIHVRMIPFDSYGCEDTLTAIVKANARPTAPLRYPTVYTMINTDTRLQARNIGNGYRWQPPNGLSNSSVREPVFNYDKDQEYLIRILAANGCLTTDTVLVRVEDGADILVPDAFSPNGDGRNDRLDIFTRGLSKIRFWVFNRWGQLMFETTDPSQKWDGRFSGVPQPLETYVWIAEGTTLTGRIIRKRGQTVLIR